MTHAAIRSLLKTMLWLPAAALAQGNVPLTGSMAASGGSVVTAVPDATPVPPRSPVATVQAGNAGPVWKIEVPLSNQAARQGVAANNATASTDSMPAASPAQVITNASANDGYVASNHMSSPPHERVGDTTAELLATQAQGTHAGKQIDTLGATASLSYKRYLDSFTLPIPQWFKEAVEPDKGGN